MSNDPALGDILTAIGDRRVPVSDLGGTVSNLSSSFNELRHMVHNLDSDRKKPRVNLMARIDRLQHRIDLIDDHFTMSLVTMSLGYAAPVEERATSIDRRKPNHPRADAPDAAH